MPSTQYMYVVTQLYELHEEYIVVMMPCKDLNHLVLILSGVLQVNEACTQLLLTFSYNCSQQVIKVITVKIVLISMTTSCNIHGHTIQNISSLRLQTYDTIRVATYDNFISKFLENGNFLGHRLRFKCSVILPAF